MFLEDDRSLVIPLDGEWAFRLGDGEPRVIRVPSAWEAETGDHLTEGPAVYRRSVVLPDAGGRWVLECDAVSFAVTVRVNGHEAGAHAGMWSRWQVDITPFVRPGENWLELEVWKPGEGRYRLRESLAGFLPDVCNTFGGIWQPVRLRRLAGPAFADLRVRADARGVVRVDGRLVGGGNTDGLVRIAELGAASPLAISRRGAFSARLRVRGHDCWSPNAPRVYDLCVEAGDACVRRRIGFRSIRARGATTLLNGRPVHLRGVLDWGWDERRMCPTPSPDEVRDSFAKARRLGFNLFKLCLYVPHDVVFDLADREGMFLWLELPMWLPQVTPAFRVLALREYEAILQRVHHHPSIVVVSLGCELGAEVDAGLLAELRAVARHWLPDALLCDNSGSGEAYGNPTDEADFYDYHFYAEPHHLQALNAHFARPYLPARPWIYGEFCDADTTRDWSRLQPAPFWVAGPVTMQRDELVWAREHAQRLHAAGVVDGGASLTRLGRLQATAVRKFILEQVRQHHATGGYVVTGWRDTPIATSGMVDDAGALKFDALAWRQFNADRVLVLDRERRRQWTHGGDRPVHRDPYCWWRDEPLELHVVLSNGGEAVRRAELRWQLREGEALLADGVCLVGSVPAGTVRQVGILRIAAPLDGESDRLRELRLDASLTDSADCVVANDWTLWVVPDEARRAAASLWDACCGLTFDSAVSRAGDGEWVVVPMPCTDAPAMPWRSFVVPRPFWRESIHVFSPGLAEVLGTSSAQAHADMRCYGLATDRAIDVARLGEVIGLDASVAAHLPWRRFDARALTWLDYVVALPVGRGRLVVTTLRLGGGADNPMGAWLLTRLALGQAIPGGAF